MGAEAEWQEIGKALQAKIAHSREEAKAAQQDETDWAAEIANAECFDDLNEIYNELKKRGIESEYLQALSLRKEQIEEGNDSE